MKLPLLSRSRVLAAIAGSVLLLVLLAQLQTPHGQQLLRSPVLFIDNVSDRVLGMQLRESMRSHKSARLRDLGYQDVASAPSWSFRTGTYLWDWFTPYWPCADRERVGRHGDGGKWVCGMRTLQSLDGCVVYSYGVRDDVSFETELLERTSCTLFAFDPSVASLPAGGRIAALRGRFHFQQLGLANVSAGMYETLSATMHRLGHKRLTLLKVDVEHAEKSALPTLFAALRSAGRSVPFSQLLLEVHHSDTRPAPTVQLMEDLERMDVVPFMNEINLVPCINKENPKVIEYSFLSLREDDMVLTA